MNLAFGQEGSGADVLLLHAGVADRRMWDPLVAELGGAVRTLRPDLRGFGETRAPAGPYVNARDVVALLDARGVRRACVVGASFGGQVALELATLAPERVASLVLLAPALADHAWSPRVEAFGEAEDAAIGAGDLDEAVRLNVEMWAPGASVETRALVAEMQRTAFELQLATGLDAQEADVRLDAISAPATIAVGDADAEDFAVIAERLVRELRDAELHRIGGAGHLLALERPREVAALVQRRVGEA